MEESTVPVFFSSSFSTGTVFGNSKGRGNNFNLNITLKMSKHSNQKLH